MKKSSKWKWRNTFNKKYFFFFPNFFFFVRQSNLDFLFLEKKSVNPAFEFGLEFFFDSIQESAYFFLVLRPVVLAVDSLLSNCFSLLRKGNRDKIRACFIAIVINRCCFKVNLFTRLDNIFPCSLINRLIKLMFL